MFHVGEVEHNHKENQEYSVHMVETRDGIYGNIPNIDRVRVRVRVEKEKVGVSPFSIIIQGHFAKSQFIGRSLEEGWTAEKRE